MKKASSALETVKSQTSPSHSNCNSRRNSQTSANANKSILSNSYTLKIGYSDSKNFINGDLRIVPEYDAKLDTFDYELSNDKKTVCFHCAKLIEMFKIRHKAITFASSQTQGQLDGLRFT